VDAVDRRAELLGGLAPAELLEQLSNLRNVALEAISTIRSALASTSCGLHMRAASPATSGRLVPSLQSTGARLERLQHRNPEPVVEREQGPGRCALVEQA
jgi:hypothetical protein